MALARGGFTNTGPRISNGATGTVQFLSTVAGGLSTVTTPGPGFATADVEVYYRDNGVGPTLLMRTQALGSRSLCFSTRNDFNNPLGEVRARGWPAQWPGCRVDEPDPIVFWTPFSFHVDLVDGASGPTSISVLDSAFDVPLTGIKLRNAAHQRVVNFAVSSESGTAYDSDGVVLPPR